MSQLQPPPKNNRNRRRSYRNKVNAIAHRLPLEVPVFDAKSGLRLSKTMVFTSRSVESEWDCFNTLCGLTFYFFCDIYEINTVLRNHICRSEYDPHQFDILFDMVYEIAQNPANGTIVWLLLLRKGSVFHFWYHPLCEPRLMGIIAGYAAQPPHCSSASIPPELDPRSLHS